MRSIKELSSVDPDDMTDEERERYVRINEEALGQLQLQGLVMAKEPAFDPKINFMSLQTAYGPPPMPNTGIAVGLAPVQPPVTPCRPEWTDDTHWKCSCNTVNEGKFCTECGSPAPPRPWKCPECGSENTGNYCTECGRKHI